jgi:hypothetical protein
MADRVSEINQQRLQFGLPRLQASDPEFQRAEQFQGLQDQAQPIIAQGNQQADLKAANTFNQIKQAGLSGLAEQFRRSQKAIAFDTARRGTLGGSRQIERGAEAQAQVQQGAGNVLNQAQGAANAQLNQDRAGIFGFQSQLAQADPFDQLSTQNQLQNFQQQGQSALGQFDLSQQQENIRAGSAQNRAQNIFGALSAVGTGTGGVIRNNADNTFLNNVKALG